MFDQDLADSIKGTEFEKIYLEAFVNRFTSGSIRLESDEESEEYANANNYINNLMAIRYLLSYSNDKMDLSVIKNVAKMLEYESNEKGFRRTTAYVEGSDIPRARPVEIIPKMYILLENYYKVWIKEDEKMTEDDIFFREANFHLQFLIIHPFEDGNGRTARVLTTGNFLRQGIRPGVITKKVKKEYCDIIESQNVEKLAEFFKKLSLEEEKVFNEMKDTYSLRVKR